VTAIETRDDDDEASKEDNNSKLEVTSEQPPEKSKDQLHPLEETPDEKTARGKLGTCPRFTAKPAPQHQAIRQDEQSLLEHELLKNNLVWLAADWGTGIEGFLAAALSRFTVQGGGLDIFHLRCDDATDIDSLLALFPQQFGMPLQAFCGYAAAIPNVFLLLDGIHPELCSGESLSLLRKIALAIIDYSPDMRVILSARIVPVRSEIPVLELHSLEVPDVRTYLLYHPDGSDVRDPDLIDKLHERSGGLPMHLDRLLKAMKVGSPDLVFEAELDRPTAIAVASQSVPKALVHSVAMLARPVVIPSPS
jgi:hypothetical protein